jgi:hypothetical protein
MSFRNCALGLAPGESVRSLCPHAPRSQGRPLAATYDGLGACRRVRARHRRNDGPIVELLRRGALPVVMMVALAATLSACGTTGSASQPSPSASSATGPAAILQQAVSGLDRLTVERSDAFPQNHIRYAFPATVSVTDVAQVRLVAKALLELPAMPKGILCTIDLGIVYRLTFSGGGQNIPPVSIRATGCQQVTGLGATRWLATSPGFWHTLGLAMGLAKPDWAAFRGSGP